MSSRSTAAGRRPRGRTLALAAVLATTALAAVPSAASAWTASPGMGAGFIFVTDSAGVDNDFVVQQAGSKVTIRDLNGDPVTNWVTYCAVVSVDTLECDPGSGTVPPALNVTLGGGNDRLDASGYVSAVNVAPGAGADWVRGGDAADAIAGGDGDDTLDGAGGNDRIEGGAGEDTLHGGDGNDQLFGGADDDLLTGGAGHDVLEGNDGDDHLDGELGSDQQVGGAGHDVVDYSARTRAVSVTLGTGRLNDGEAGEGDTAFPDVEEVWGGSGDDALRAVDFAPGSVLRGGAGNDALHGGAETDLLDGGAGDDLLDGGGAIDELLCGDDLDSYRTDGLDTVAADCELLIP